MKLRKIGCWVPWEGPIHFNGCLPCMKEEYEYVPINDLMLERHYHTGSDRSKPYGNKEEWAVVWTINYDGGYGFTNYVFHFGTKASCEEYVQKVMPQ